MNTTKKILTTVTFLSATSLMAASNGESIFKACATCHGANAEKKH